MSIQEEIETLEEDMLIVYEEMLKLHYTIAPLPIVQAKTNEKRTMFRQAATTINNIREWAMKYLDGQTILPTKDWIISQNDKVQIHIKVQS